MTTIDWGTLRRVTPISNTWGLDRGEPVDRYYIDKFLDRHRADVRGRVLEVKDRTYTHRFAPPETAADVIDIDPSNVQATLVADLTKPETIPAARYDCFICTQTLHIIYDLRAAIGSIERLLKPGGVLLCTLPVVSRINDENGGLESGDYWRFTTASARGIFAEAFGPDQVAVSGFGNVLACVAFLYGLSAQELSATELDHHDPWFPLLVGVRATKAGQPAPPA